MLNQANGTMVMSDHNGDELLQLNNLNKALMVLRAINHSLRQKIIGLLDSNGRLSVTDLYVNLRLEQSVASQHLAILRNAGVVQTEREGKYIYYSLNKNRLAEIKELVGELAA